jgi:hypothetical protein
MVENWSPHSCLRSLPLELERDGFAILDEAVAPDVIAELRSRLPAANPRAGLRNLLGGQPVVRKAARSSSIRQAVEAVLGPRCFAVRAILFDKTPEANWKVAWHQDLTIAVHQRRCVAGFTAWSEKDGVVHVQPPVPILERMLAVRVHLDDCGPDSGPLRVLPGSHREGRLDAAAIDSADWRSPETGYESWLCWSDGQIDTKNPVPEFIDKMAAVARDLHAKV